MVGGYEGGSLTQTRNVNESKTHQLHYTLKKKGENLVREFRTRKYKIVLLCHFSGLHLQIVSFFISYPFTIYILPLSIQVIFYPLFAFYIYGLFIS